MLFRRIKNRLDCQLLQYLIELIMKALFQQVQSNININKKIFQICYSQWQKIKQVGYKNSKTFFVSQAYHFFLELIHLHSQEVNHFIQAVLKDSMNKRKNKQFEQITSFDFFSDKDEYSKKKNLTKQTIYGQLQKILKYFLNKECEGKSLLEIQNVELQIQCSLNYTCPLCLKEKINEETKSLKLINSSHLSSIQQNIHQKQSKTSKQITSQEIKQHILLQLCKKETLKQRLLDIQQSNQIRQNQLKQKHKKGIKAIWNALSDLMFLQKDKLFNQKKIQSNDKRSQNLYNQLYARNTYNEKMIKHFYKKMHRKEDIFLNRSLSFRARQNENVNYQIQSVQQNKIQKIYTSLRYIDKQFQYLHFKQKIGETKKSILSPIPNFNRNIIFDKLVNKSNSLTKNSTFDLYSSINSSVDRQVKQNSLKKKKVFIKQKKMELPPSHLNIRPNRRLFDLKNNQLPHIFEDKIVRLNSPVQVQ